MGNVANEADWWSTHLGISVDKGGLQLEVCRGPKSQKRERPRMCT